MDKLALVGTITGAVGCALGGISLYLHWRSHQADRAKLAISATMGISESVANPEPHPYMEVTMRNAGRRVVRVHGIWIEVPARSGPTTSSEGVTVTPMEERIGLFPSKEHTRIDLEEHERFVLKMDPFPNEIAKYLGSKELSLKVEDSLGGIHETVFLPCSVPEHIAK